MTEPEHDFRIRPGKPRSTRAPRPKAFVDQVLRAAHKAGHVSTRPSGKKRSHSNFGRGQNRFGRSRLFSSSRRVMVAARIARHKGRAYRAAPLSIHLAYLRRDGVSRDGERGLLFDAETDGLDGSDFAERCEDDRHHFRFIISPEDAAEMEDLRGFTRDLAHRMEADLGTRLDWVAVDHWNTDNPHVHLIVRGVDDHGGDLVIARDYISSGLRSRAEDLVALELGPKPEHEIQHALEREVTAERWTRLDRKPPFSKSDRVFGQCEDMLRTTNEAYVWLYSPVGISVLRAGSMVNTSPELVPQMRRQSLHGFMTRAFMSWSGDYRLGDLSKKSLEMMTEEFRVKQAVLIHATEARAEE